MGANQYTKQEFCTLPFCFDGHKALGFCYKHYKRAKRHNGDPYGGRTPNGELLNFIEYAIHSDSKECIIWPYGKDKYGYGKLKINGKLVSAHRLVLLQIAGDPPSDEESLALHDPNSCTSRACINSYHLRWGSAQDNADDILIAKAHEKSIVIENIPESQESS